MTIQLEFPTTDIKPPNAHTQRADVLRHLQTLGGLTQAQAAQLYRIGRLAARVGELREDGHNITTENVKTTTGARVGRYHLIK